MTSSSDCGAAGFGRRVAFIVQRVDCHAVPATQLCFVERGVRPPQQARRLLGRLAPLRDTDARRQEERRAIDRWRVGDQRCAQPLGHRQGARHCGARHHHEELFAAETADRVDLAQPGLERCGGVLQRAVAGGVPVVVVT